MHTLNELPKYKSDMLTWLLSDVELKHRNFKYAGYAIEDVIASSFSLSLAY